MDNNSTYNLKEPCPKCGDKIYAFYHMYCSDVPETGLWHVECTKCDWKHNDTFPTLAWLEEEFTITFEQKDHVSIH